VPGAPATDTASAAATVDPAPTAETTLDFGSRRAGKVVWSLGAEMGLQVSFLHALAGDVDSSEDLLEYLDNPLSFDWGFAGAY
jgi:hypothetical protein